MSSMVNKNNRVVCSDSSSYPIILPYINQELFGNISKLFCNLSSEAEDFIQFLPLRCKNPIRFEPPDASAFEEIKSG